MSYSKTPSKIVGLQINTIQKKPNLRSFGPQKILGPKSLGAGHELFALHLEQKTNPRFPWKSGDVGPLLKVQPFGVRSCEVAIIWPEKNDPYEYMDLSW